MLFADDRSIVAARVNGVPRDLTYVVEDGDTVEPVAIESPEGRAILRHSTAHVLAQAVQDLFPEAKLGIGPPIENGFYYDFDVPRAVPPRRPGPHREADARDRQGGADASRVGSSATTRPARSWPTSRTSSS